MAEKHAILIGSLDLRIQEIGASLAGGRQLEAETLCQALVSAQPRNAGAAHLWGVLSLAKGHNPEGIRSLKRATRLDPANFYYLKDLGLAMLAESRLPDARKYLQEAQTLRPGHQEVCRHLGECLCRMREYEAALTVFGSASGARSAGAMGLYPEIARLRTWRLEAAIRGLRQFVTHQPDDVEAQLGLTSALFGTGDISGALESIRAAEKITSNREVASFLCRMLHYDAGADRAAIAAQQRQFAKTYCPATKREPLPVRRRASRRLRVGYVSALFRQHSVHLKPILQWHDRGRFEVTCFSDGRPVRNAGIVSIDTRGMGNDELLRCIRKYRIDILVECDGHAKGGARLPVFAARGAPVQFALALYPGTTGVRNIDFRITDSLVDPPGTEAFFTEKLVRLSRLTGCDPRAARTPPSPLPAIRNGFVTFGSFNIPVKLNENVVRLWADILRRVPKSRLLLHHLFDQPGTGTVNPAIRTRFLRMFREFGISARRLELLGELREAEHLRTYDRIDIALDPFPYNGTRTTCDALLRGVPVVTLAGTTSAGRVGVSLLSVVGLPQFVGTDVRHYAKIAVNAASDLQSLAVLRSQLGDRARTSIADGQSFIAELEDAYIGAWLGQLPRRGAV